MKAASSSRHSRRARAYAATSRPPPAALDEWCRHRSRRCTSNEVGQNAMQSVSHRAGGRSPQQEDEEGSEAPREATSDRKRGIVPRAISCVPRRKKTPQRRRYREKRSPVATTHARAAEERIGIGDGTNAEISSEAFLCRAFGAVVASAPLPLPHHHPHHFSSPLLCTPFFCSPSAPHTTLLLAPPRPPTNTLPLTHSLSFLHTRTHHILLLHHAR